MEPQKRGFSHQNPTRSGRVEAGSVGVISGFLTPLPGAEADMLLKLI